MDKNLFRYYMSKHNENYKSLTMLLNLSEKAVFNKINCKGGDFTRKEIAILAEHWQLTGDEVKQIFLSEN